jgi:hypothetical protein
MCETWSLTLREECRVRMFETRVLRIVFGPKKEEVTEHWRKLHNEECHNPYSSPNIEVIKSRRMRWVGHVACMEEMRNAYKIIVSNPERREHFRNLGVHGRIILK